MNRIEYLQDRQVASFVAWMAEQCTEREFHLHIMRSRYAPAGFQGAVVGIEGLLGKYHWASSWRHPVEDVLIRSDDWGSTQQTCTQLADGLRAAVEAGDEAAARDWSLCVLQWGGVSGAKPFLNEMAEAGQLAGYLESVCEQLRLDNPDFEDGQITATSISRFDSGLTKIHSILDETGSPIYDSRVGAAISMFVAEFMGNGNAPGELLRFPAGDARGHQSRNPGDFGYPAAPRLHTSQVSRADWARSQLRLGWILQAVAKRENIFQGLGSETEILHAFQGALFMAGYDLRCFAPGGSENTDSGSACIHLQKFRNIVPTSFTMNSVVPLLQGYRQAASTTLMSKAGFVEWQVRHSGVGTANAAGANCYPLRSAEFDIFDRDDQAFQNFTKGGYGRLLRLIGKIEPSLEERENNCLHCVYVTGRLYLQFEKAGARRDWLISKGLAGTSDAASTLMSVGRLVGRHFELLDDDNRPNDNFRDYFGDPWGDMIAGI